MTDIGQKLRRSPSATTSRPPSLTTRVVGIHSLWARIVIPLDNFLIVFLDRFPYAKAI
jgi:hypothetical protein